MRNLRHWGGWAVLLLALGTAVASATPPLDDDDDDGSAKSAKVVGPDPAARPRDGWNPFLTRLFGGTSKKPDPKPDKDNEADKKHDEPAPRISTLREMADHYRDLEKAKLLRRQAVCQRLREIAYETGDEELERKAFQLDELAAKVFEERTGRLSQMMERAELQSDRTDGVREGKP